MQSTFLLNLIILNVYAKSHTNCPVSQDVVESFRNSYDEFAVNLFKTSVSNYGQMVISPILTWKTLVDIAEGTNHQTRDEIFKVLNLPKDFCSLEQYYELALTLDSKSEFFKVEYQITLFIDQDVKLNMQWSNRTRFLEAISVPIKNEPESTKEVIKKFASLEESNLDLSGNAVLINTLDFNGLWTTSFEDAVIENTPFYDQFGEQICSVDLMKVKRRVRIGSNAGVFSKVIELPVSVDEEYRMVFGVIDEDIEVQEIFNLMDKDAVKYVQAALKGSPKLVEIAIPLLDITFETDMKDILQKMDIINVWNDPEANRNISIPPAEPSSYIQRATINFNTKGVNPPTTEDISGEVVDKFMANRPFAYALYHAKTYTNLIAGLVTNPKISSN